MPEKPEPKRKRGRPETRIPSVEKATKGAAKAWDKVADGQEVEDDLTQAAEARSKALEQLLKGRAPTSSRRQAAEKAAKAWDKVADDHEAKGDLTKAAEARSKALEQRAKVRALISFGRHKRKKKRRRTRRK